VHAVTVEEPEDVAHAVGVDDWGCERLDGQIDTRFTIDADHLDAMIGRLHAARIHTLTVTPPSLAALFLRTYGESLDAKEIGETLAEAGR
jgi:ABC-2 type transport system ATP-binding protein